jgi:endo-1,4-beta-D-glucanase Y
MALLQAERRWGGYMDTARTLITNIKDFETCEKDGLLVLRPGDAWAFCDEGNPETNPSYFAPGYYRAFAHFVPEQADHWLTLLDDTYTMMHTNQAAMGGLISDWCTFTGAPARSNEFGYEACRVPWRMAVDYAWSGSEDARQILEGLHGAGAGDTNIDDSKDNSCFRGAYALTSIISDEATFDAAVDHWLTVVKWDNAYYQVTLRNLYLLVAGGNFPSGASL